MNLDIVVAMDESEDQDPGVSNEFDFTVIEGEIEEQRRIRVLEAEQAGGYSEGGDVMVEVLGYEVFVDGVRKNNNEVSGGGGGGGKSGNFGDGDDRSREEGEGCREFVHGSLTSYGGENPPVQNPKITTVRISHPDIVISMDESEDYDPRVSNESESTVVEGESSGIEEHQRIRVLEAERAAVGSECGGVMAEVLGCEVFVDDVRRNNGEVSGGDDGNRENLGDGAIVHGNLTSYEGENLTGGIVYEGVSGSGISLDGNDVLRDGVTDDVEKEKVVEIGVERLSERKSEGVIEMELDESGNGLHEGSASCYLESGVQDSTTPVMSMVDGNKHSNAGESVNAVKQQGADKGFKIVRCASVVSESRTKEEVVLGKASNTEHIASMETISHGEDETVMATEPVASVEDKQVEAEGRIQMVDEKLNSRSVTDILVTAAPTVDLVGTPKQDGKKNCEGHAAHGRPLLQYTSLADCVVQEKECTPDTLLVDVSAIEGIAQFDSNMEDIQEEDADISEQFESPEQEQDEELFSDSATPQSNDENGELEGHAADELPHWPGESFVEDVDQGNKFTPVISPIDENAMIGSDIDDSQEEAGLTVEFESSDEQDINEESVSYSTKRRSKELKNARHGYGKSGNRVKDHRVSYWLPPENEGEFSVFDLVWGKVKSHPWWPGQIFHPFDSSEKAKKYFKKDCYLVAYFGDKSFAWNEGSALKPFFKHFSEEEEQSNSESFQNALSCALEEVSRRVELGLACSCLSEEVHDKLKYQMVENGGIQEESSKREGVDWSTGADSFQPGKLIQYIKALALFPTSEPSRLDLVIAKAQMLAFYRLKGCDRLPEFQYYYGLAESDAGTSPHAEQGEMELVDSVGGNDRKSKLKGPRRRKHNLKDIVYQRRKEKTITELMGDSEYYFDGDFDSHDEENVTLTSSTKRRASLHPTDDFTGQQSKKSKSSPKVSKKASANPQHSFKVGDCIRRVASQLTRSSSIFKNADEDSSDKHSVVDIDEVSDAPNEVSDPPNDSLDEEIATPKKEAPIDELLSQLYLSARDPMKSYSFFPDVVSFFSEFRNLAVSTQRQRMRKAGRKRKQPSAPATVPGVSATFKFDDKNDSYWTDMVIQNNSASKPAKRGRKRKVDQVLSPGSEKSLKPKRHSRKQYFHGNHELTAELPLEIEKPPEELPTGPTELVMTFSEAGSIPSEVNLNKMFRRFAPLKESETEIDTQSGRAKVLFKKRSDAEVAYSSATMFNIFGSTLVNYQLNYTPLVPIKTAPSTLTEVQEDATFCL